MHILNAKHVLLFSQVSLIKQRPGSKIIMKTKWPLTLPAAKKVRAEQPSRARDCLMQIHKMVVFAARTGPTLDTAA